MASVLGVRGGLSIDHLVAVGAPAAYDQLGGPGLFGALGGRLIAGSTVRLDTGLPDADPRFETLFTSLGIDVSHCRAVADVPRLWILNAPEGRRIVETAPPADVEIEDPDENARVLVLGWGSTYGPIGAACRALRQRGLPIAQAHLRHLAPLPANLGTVLKGYDKVVIPEMNLGQLAHLIRGRYLIDAVPFNQVSGLPFTAATLENMLEDVVKNG